MNSHAMMLEINNASSRAIFLLLLFLILLAPKTSGQKQTQTVPADDVVLVKTELVQTDVTVVDKRGRFVAGLKPEQFELRVDNQLQPLAFFEQVAAGSAAEEKQLAAARKANATPLAMQEDKSGAGSDRGRLIFFFVDDVHLAGDSLPRARSLLTHFLEEKMAANDRVAIVSTSGQIGFLQQLTDNKAVLREAIDRLNYKFNPETIASKVSISEVDANLVANRGDRGLFAYLVEATMKEFQMQNPINAVNIVKNRVRQINVQSKLVEMQTLSKLESLIRSTGPLAGRKLFFFISDGFVMDIKRSSGRDVMQSLTNEAARVGAVIYTLDTRTNFLGAGVDASKNDYPDFGSRTAGRTLAESKMPQEPLETLADETGGRAYLNSNALDEGLAQALTESSAYYLLAWRPDTENQKAGKSRIDVVVRDRPDLRVRMRRHFFDSRTNPAVKSATPEGVGPSINTAENELRQALGSLYPRRELPTLLSAGYVQTEGKGPAIDVSMQIDAEALTFDGPDGKQEAIVDVLGIALDDRGLFSTFKQKVKVPREAVLSKNQRFVIWSQSLPLPPGLYQVRVATRDSRSGHTGSAIGWIEIPQFAPGSFSMSSLFLRERPAVAAPPDNLPNGSQPMLVDVDHRFARSSIIRFQTYVYNASRVAGAPDVWIAASVFRGSQQVMIVAPSKIPPDVSPDSWRLPYWSEIALNQLPPGAYTLQVSANDKGAGTIASQRINFSVERVRE
jgi:VWFA-related protein